MVDVGGKPDTERVALARGEVTMRPETLRLIAEKGMPKGDVLAVAQVAGIMAAKRVPDLIPLCHSLLLNPGGREPGDQSTAASCVEIAARCAREQDRRRDGGAHCVSVAALTIYDMAKAVERTMRIGNIRLVSKSGGRSGDIRWKKRHESRVRLFCGLRESVSTGELVQETACRLDGPGSGGPAGGAIPALGTRRCMFAVNSTYVTPQVELHDGDEVALIPVPWVEE